MAARQDRMVGYVRGEGRLAAAMGRIGFDVVMVCSWLGGWAKARPGVCVTRGGPLS